MADNVFDLLTVVFTTSPTPSSPSTELLSSVVESYRTHCPALLHCRAIVVFDTYDHITPTPLLKRAQVTAQIAHDYQQYKQNVKALITREYHHPSHTSNNNNHHHNHPQEPTTSSIHAEYGSPRHDANSVEIFTQQTPNGSITFLEPTHCLGFSLAVRSALRLCRTPYVWIQQHDWTLAATIPIQSMLDVMRASEEPSETLPPIKYICLPSVRMLSYAAQTDNQRFPGLRALTASLKQSFDVPLQPGQQLPLTPVFFWYDKPHVALVEHYLARVFPSRYATRRGDFIEDAVGHRARDQMKLGQWRKWACWLYYPDEGRLLCLKHLDGRRWRGTEGELKRREMHLAQKALSDQHASEMGTADTAEMVDSVVAAPEPDQAGLHNDTDY